MEHHLLFKNFMSGLMDALEVSGLSEYDAMHIEHMKFLERIESSTVDSTVFKKPMRFGKKSKMHQSIIHVDEQNFLMPAPMERPPRNRNRNTKSCINPKPTRVTRSSKLVDIPKLDPEKESEPTTKKTRRTRQIEESICEVTQTSADSSSVLTSESEISLSSCSKKGRRTTRKRTTATLPRASRATRASTRASYKCKPSVLGGKRSSVGKELRSRNTSVVHVSPKAPETRITRSRIANETMTISDSFTVEELTQTKRVTRNQAATTIENDNRTVSGVRKEEGVKSPDLITASGQNTVKQRVKEFEGLIVSNKVDGESPGMPGSPYVGSPAPKKAKATLPSPLIKNTSKKGGIKNKTPLLSNLSDIEMIEEEDPGNRTFQVIKSKDKKKGKDEKVNNGQAIASFDEVLDADDEWVSDEEETSGSSKNAKFLSSTPSIMKKAADAKAPVLSTKALRSRNVQKISSEISITSVTKSKPVENEVKEAELKKKMEKEEEARKRKDEIMKKRTETMKKKREEKMAKVKRTREEMQKDVQDTKAKKGRGKKAQQVAEVEEVLKSPLTTLKTPPSKTLLAMAIANSTFNVNDQEGAVSSYDLTPCWQDAPPVQPDNPNDYGVADKSECSSEEENDPRKEVPLWAKIGNNHPNHLSQALMRPEWITLYWHSKPRKPTILEFFGDQVSKRTLKRGLNYRTSSACWNTPPLKKLH